MEKKNGSEDSQISKNDTPPKTNISPEKGPFQKEIPRTQSIPFFGSMLVFWGVSKMLEILSQKT